MLFCRFPQLQFQYKDPERNFNRRRVHGLVAKLIKVKDSKTATGLEVAAGGKVRQSSVKKKLKMNYSSVICHTQ